MKTKEEIQDECLSFHRSKLWKMEINKAMDEYASQFQQEWIPVEVRLPDTTRTNFITAKDLSGRIIYLDHREHIWYHYGIGVWYADIKMFKDKYPDLTIIAWQRIIEPQPYNPTKS
jgi:hypothetical protein